MLLGIPHQVIWTRPAGRATPGILARVWDARGINRARQTRLRGLRGRRNRRMARRAIAIGRYSRAASAIRRDRYGRLGYPRGGYIVGAHASEWNAP